MEQIHIILFIPIFSYISIQVQSASLKTSVRTYNFTFLNIDFNGKSLGIRKNADDNLGITSEREIYIGNLAGEFVGGSSESIGIGYQTMSISEGFRNIGIGMYALKFINQ